MKNPNLDDFHEAWWWLCEHPYFFYANTSGNPKYDNEPGFANDLYIMVVKVNPLTDEIDDNPALNHDTRVWLECGPWHKVDDDHPFLDPKDPSIQYTGEHSHDPDLDCGGDTFEEAVCNLAKLVMEQHGDYNEYTLCSHCLCRKEVMDGPRDEMEDWFCSPECGAHGVTGWKFDEIPDSDMLRLVPVHEYAPCEHYPVPAN